MTTKGRSYSVRVKRDDVVLLTEDVGDRLEGAIGTVISESNAGFRGIEAYVQFFHPAKKMHVSTGKLRVL